MLCVINRLKEYSLFHENLPLHCILIHTSTYSNMLYCALYTQNTEYCVHDTDLRAHFRVNHCFNFGLCRELTRSKALHTRRRREAHDHCGFPLGWTQKTMFSHNSSQYSVLTMTVFHYRIAQLWTQGSERLTSDSLSSLEASDATVWLRGQMF